MWRAGSPGEAACPDLAQTPSCPPTCRRGQEWAGGTQLGLLAAWECGTPAPGPEFPPREARAPNMVVPGAPSGGHVQRRPPGAVWGLLAPARS